MTVAKPKPAQVAAVAALKELLEPGDCLHMHMTHVSSSGMNRSFNVYTFKGGELKDITSEVATALGLRETEKGVPVGGAGMDMGDALRRQVERHVNLELTSTSYTTNEMQFLMDRTLGSGLALSRAVLSAEKPAFRIVKTDFGNEVRLGTKNVTSEVRALAGKSVYSEYDERCGVKVDKDLVKKALAALGTSMERLQGAEKEKAPAKGRGEGR